VKKKKIDYLWICFIGMTIVAIILSSIVVKFTIKKDIHPLDRIDDSNIKFEQNKVIIEGNFIKGIFVGTNSMTPVLFRNATSLSIIPLTSDEIYVGDIITFNHPKKGLTVHRVIKKSYDNKGIYFVTKGDNCYTRDLYKVRFEDITKVMVGIIW